MEILPAHFPASSISGCLPMIRISGEQPAELVYVKVFQKTFSLSFPSREHGRHNNHPYTALPFAPSLQQFACTHHPTASPKSDIRLQAFALSHRLALFLLSA